MKIFSKGTIRLSSVLVTIGVLALSGFGGPANARSNDSPIPPTVRAEQFTVVNATLTDDMRLTLDRYTVPAGNVHFLVTNSGGATHELVVLKTDLAADKLVANATVAGKVEEQGHMGETGDIAGGRFNGLGLQLGAGSYVIICNEIGHYSAGMRVAFTVTAPVVNVSLDDKMSITLDKTTVYEGPVTFAVSNRGAVIHELVVLATNMAPDELPADPEQIGKVSEDFNIGETGDIPARRFSGLQLILAPGVYMVICNEIGHFAGGMHTTLVVLPAPTGDE